jgi:hypothetical protein
VGQRASQHVAGRTRADLKAFFPGCRQDAGRGGAGRCVRFRGRARKAKSTGRAGSAPVIFATKTAQPGQRARALQAEMEQIGTAGASSSPGTWDDMLVTAGSLNVGFDARSGAAPKAIAADNL